MPENCVFCKITQGVLPSYTIYEDDYFKAILDINPCAKGHTILIAKQHAENVYELTEDVAKQAFSSVKTVAYALKKAFQTDGLNVLQNNGVAAGQTVSHFHIHLIPRDKNDSIDLTPKVVNDYSDDEFAVTQARIIKAL